MGQSRLLKHGRRGERPAGCVLPLLFAAVVSASGAAENIDPANDGSQFAWAENGGWLNAEPLGEGGAGVEVTDSDLFGWMWGENVGWISFSCQNTASCGTSGYGVTNDGAGNLAGYAWGENVGWISFSCANTAVCATKPYGVTIDAATGVFVGRAWCENIGWITFSATSPVAFSVRTSWACPAAPPSGTPHLLLTDGGAGVALMWSALPDASGYDVVQGRLDVLRDSAGDFAAATESCLANDLTTATLAAPLPPAPGQGLWYLVRGRNCSGNGTWDVSSPGLAGPRDPGIGASANGCP